MKFDIQTIFQLVRTYVIVLQVLAKTKTFIIAVCQITRPFHYIHHTMALKTVTLPDLIIYYIER